MKQFNTDILPIIGMSPGNGYFKQDIISKIISKVIEKYKYALVFIPDIPAISTYLAMGYSQKEARNKAILKGNNLKNKVKTVLVQENISNENVYIVDWLQDIEALTLYKKSYCNVRNLFENNREFNSQILATTRPVLEDTIKEGIDIIDACKIGVHYILAEFAFLEICPYLFSCKNALYIYHRDWPVYQNYISGDFDLIKKNHLGFKKLTF